MKNESKIHHLFSYPVYASNIGVDKNFFNDVMLKENFIEMGSKNGYFTDNQNILHKDNYSFLKKKIDDEVENYVRNILHVNKKQQFYLTTSWINRHSNNHHAHPHIHKNAVISGVYYLKTFENCGDIYFSVDYNSHVFNNMIKLDFDSINTYNCDEYSVRPIDGDILLFPSKLTHRVSHNLTQMDRYSLAFNYFVKGEFGNMEAYLELK